MSKIEDIKVNMRKYSSVELAKIANIEKKLANVIKQNSKNVFWSIGITEEEANLLLEWIVQRDRQLITKGAFALPNNFDDIDLTGFCKLSQTVVYNLLINMGLNPRCSIISTILGKDSDYWGDHMFNSVSLPIVDENLKVKEKNYLIDVTYKQFFSEKSLSPGYFCTRSPNGLEFARTLLTQGYIELTEDNAKIYGDSFLLTSIAYREHMLHGKNIVTDLLVSDRNGEQFLNDLISPAKQEDKPYYLLNFLQYYYNINRNDLKTPLMETTLSIDEEDFQIER